ncbi:5-(carboxyamino)imidazole ribonucleotide synthase [Carnobacterium mobile]|uniref:5-(carboxyamino)imidazole ribonucleotide synthase n=1 Tax=Carnobacterium mobile TaxID=2750 RepID=UPI00054F947D|nr:5-(carboxyamino)imidazole ribonucleotide synthase [Carnobacterium mobile]
MSLPNLIVPGETIGIIGGGQLGRMLALAAKQMGYHVGVLDPEKNCPTAQIADWHIVAKYDNQEALMDLAMKSDVLTYEFENVDADRVDRLKKTVSVPQGSELLSITQDRLLEKAYLEMNNINSSPYATIISLEDIKESVSSIGFPCILKTIRGTDDDKGQRVLYDEEDIAGCAELLQFGTCVLEAWIPFERELSIVIVRDEAGKIATFPVAETIHRQNKLHETIVPARVPIEVTEEVERISKSIADQLNLVGTLGIDMFLTPSGALYVNKLAPRPHSSGNYSLEACSMSQFEAHIRAICGWPLPEVNLLSPAVTVSIFGEHMRGSEMQIQLKPDWHFHYYGKEEPVNGSQMGHITILTENIEKTLTNINDTGIWG